MSARMHNERGIALPMAIFALVVIGGMVAGSFFIATQEQAVGRNSVRLQQAFSAAEEGAQLQMANWESATYNAMIVGDSVTFSGTLSTGTGWYRGSIRRLSDMMFLVRSEGFNRDSTTRQQLGLLARLRPIEVTVRSALATTGTTDLRGSSLVSGHDVNPPDTEGCDLGASLPGVTTSGTITGNCGTDCIEGSDPKVDYDPTLTNDSLLTFGDLTFDDLEALATVTYTSTSATGQQVEPSVTADGRCNTSNWRNWGEPHVSGGVDACRDHFPIIYITGSLKVTGVRGQGILVVDGDLDVSGDLEFYGVIIVRGNLRAATGTPLLNGTIVAGGGTDLEPLNTVAGNPTVRYSSCSVTRALTTSAKADLLQERSWINLY